MSGEYCEGGRGGGRRLGMGGEKSDLIQKKKKQDGIVTRDEA